MMPIYRGFDGLDVSFRGEISEHFCAELQAAKEWAQSTHQDTCLTYAGTKMLVAESGARGGYAYRASTGRTGATWFFKKPNSKDPWGVRVSCGSFMLAEQGLGMARTEIYRIMDQLGIRLQPLGESIGRADFAVDVLAPALVLQPDHFVMHSNANRADHLDSDEMSIHGKSGRVSSVTVGKMPGRQVIVYDKRAEVIAHHKWAWFEIWNASLARAGLPALDFADPTTSRVWRIEIRAGKSHLKDRWNIRTWTDLDARFGDMITDAISAIRYVEPTSDTNRARWPQSRLWTTIAQEIESDLFEMRNFAQPDTVKHVHKEAHLSLLARQCTGLMITRAAIAGVQSADLPAFVLNDAEQLVAEFKSKPEHFESKLRESAARYDAKS